MFLYLQVSVFFFIQAMFLAGFMVEVWHIYEKIKASGMFKLLLWHIWCFVIVRIYELLIGRRYMVYWSSSVSFQMFAVGNEAW